MKGVSPENAVIEGTASACGYWEHLCFRFFLSVISDIRVDASPFTLTLNCTTRQCLAQSEDRCVGRGGCVIDNSPLDSGLNERVAVV